MKRLITHAFVVLAITGPARAADQDASPGVRLELPARLSPEALDEIDRELRGLGRSPDWAAIHKELDARPQTPVTRFTRAWTELLRKAVWGGERAEATLRALHRQAKASSDDRLAAHLRLFLGRGQLLLHHNAEALATLRTSVVELRRLGDARGLVQALNELATGLIHHSRRPRDALPYINELLMATHRLGMKDEEELAAALYEDWRKLIAEVDDYFGRARRRMQYFPHAIGIPEDADLVAFVDGVLIMNGDTDDQMPAAPPVFVSFDGQFTRRMALPSDTLELRGSLLDSRRNLWAATNRGLFRYDGERFLQLVNPDLPDEDGNELEANLRRIPGEVEVQNAPLPSNIINEVKEGPDGRLALATNAGVSVFDPGSSAWEHHTRHNAPFVGPVERVALMADGGLVAAWQHDFAVRLPSGRWRSRPFEFPPAAGRPDPKLFGLLVDRDGHPWVHGLGGGQQLEGTRVIRMVDRRFSALTRNVNHVLRAADGAYWFASTDGVCRQEGAHCAALHGKRWMAAEWSLDLLEWPDNHIWLSVYQGGLNRFMPPHYRQVGLPEGLVQPDNKSILKLGEHIFLAHAGGLSRLDPKTGRIDNFTSGAEGVPAGELTRSLALSTGKALVTGPDALRGKGVVLFDGRRGRLLGPAEGLPDARVVGFCERTPGVALIAYRQVAVEFDTRTETVRPAPGFEGLAEQRITGLACAPGEPVWALAGGSLFEVDTSVDRQAPVRVDIRGRPRRLLRAEGQGVFLLGQQDVVRYRNGGWEPVRIDPAFDFRVRDVEADSQGRLYFSTRTGVFVTDGEVWTRITVDDGLISNTAYEMLPEGDRMWITGLGGVAAWRWPEQEPPETMLIVGEHVAHTDPDGRMHRWRTASGTEREGWVQLRGLAGAFDVPARRAGSFLPGRAGGEALPADPGLARPRVHQSDSLKVSVTAAVPYLSDGPDTFSYRHRLDGGTWQRAQSRQIELTDLTDGEHLLEVRATDRHLQTDATSARYAFVVDTPASPWLLAGSGFFAVLLVWATRRRLLWFVRRFRHRRFRPISPSPFTPQRPAADEQFVGREAELDALDDMARSSGGVAVVWGVRGTGKRSLMMRLAQRLSGTGPMVIEVDMAVAAAGGDVAHLVRGLRRALERALSEEGIEIKQAQAHTLTPEDASLAGTNDGNPFHALSITLKDLEREHPQLRITFLLDNAEVLSLSMDSDAGYGSFLFPFLRSLAQQHASVSMVLAMEGRWFDLSRRFEQLFAFATPVPVAPLPSELCLDLLDRSFRNRAFIGERELSALVDLSGGHAFLLQWIGNRLVAQLNAGQTNVCSKDLVEHLTHEATDDPETGLRTLWTELSREEKLVVATLCEHEAESPIPLEGVVEWLSAAGGKLLLEEVRRATLSLTRDGTLQEAAGRFRLRGDLFRRWVARHHSVAAILEETDEYVGHYQLVEELGGGGMGVVYKARDLVQGETVALKLLRPELSENRRSRRRFLREAKLGRGLKHPNIVRIHDYGEQAGRLYLAMEYLGGQTLAGWLKRRKLLRPSRAAAVGRHLASALAAIHELGIVHRDIKCDNVMLTATDVDGSPRPESLKLMDFGLAVGKDVSRMTRAGSLLGTVAYMSPEQARGDKVDARSDLYSLGALMYELCSGQTPFSGSDASVLHAIIYEEATPIQERAPGELPDELAALIGSLMIKEPARRPGSAREVEETLARLLNHIEPDADAYTQIAAASPQSGEPATRSGVASRTLDALKAESVLLASLERTAEGSGSSAADSIQDAGRVLLYRISAEVARGTVEDGVLQGCLEQAAEALRAERGLIVLTTGNDLSVVADHDRGAPDIPARPTLHGLLRQCVDAQLGVLYRAEPGEIEEEMGAAVGAPLWAGDRILGAILLDRKGAPAHAFDDDDLEILVGVGYLVGLALERERLYRQLLDRERLAAAGNMLAGVAHDMRGPMTVITGYTELMAMAKEEEKRADHGSIILRQVEEMNAMIANLLSFVRGESEIFPSDVDITALAEDVREVLHVQCETRGVELTVDTQGDKARVDPTRAKRIIYNLGKNALEALGDKGRLTVRLHGSAEGLTICVQDNGPGIPADLRARLFDPFVTQGKRGGTGLGLAIVKQFVDDHHGEISIESTEGAGTTFSIRLPRV